MIKLMAVNGKNMTKSVGMIGVSQLNPHGISTVLTESPISPYGPQYPQYLYMIPLSPYGPPGWSLSLDDKVAGREREEYDKKRRGPAK